MENLKRFFLASLIFILLAIPFQSSATGSCYCNNHTHTSYCNNYGCNHSCGGNSVPLDGGLSILALAGAGLGIKKAIAKRNRKKITDK